MPKIKNLLVISIFLSTLAIITTPIVALAATGPNQVNLPTPTQVSDQLHKNPITTKLNDLVTLVGGVVGIVVIGNIIFGGIQYIMAGGNPQAAADARKRITNSVIALVTFFLIWSFVQWLVPGGVFG